MEFKQLRSFTTVVNHQSFTKAASHLYISQPTISSHIKQLEDELHSRLILRTTKSIEVTPRGQELYEFASHVLSLTDDLVKRWSMDNQHMIRLGVSTIPSNYILPELLLSYHMHDPDAQFHIYQSDSKRVIDSLLHGNIEIGLVGMNNHTEGLVFLPFFTDYMSLITPFNDKFLRYKKENTPIEEILRMEPLILRESTSGSQKFMDKYFHEMQLLESELNIIAHLNDQESIKQLVASGLGISIISQKAASNYCLDQKLLCFPLSNQFESRKLYIIYRKEYILKAQTQHFIEFTKSYYRNF